MNGKKFTLLDSKFVETVKFKVIAAPQVGLALTSQEITINVVEQDCSAGAGLIQTIGAEAVFDIPIQNAVENSDEYQYDKVRCTNKRCCSLIQYDLVDSAGTVIVDADLVHLYDGHRDNTRMVRRTDRNINVEKEFYVRAKNVWEYKINVHISDLTYAQSKADAAVGRLATFDEVR